MMMTAKDLEAHRTTRGTAFSFRYLLATGAAEDFGDTLTRTILPILAVAALGAGAGFVGVLNAIGLGAFLLVGMPVGRFVDSRRDRREVMASATLVRCCVLVTLALAFMGDWISTPVLAGGAVLVGLADVVFTTAHGTVVPALVHPEGLKGAYARLAVVGQCTSIAAVVAGSALLASPGILGVLVVAASAYAASVLLQRGIAVVPDVVASNQVGRRRARLVDGLLTLRRLPALWRLTLSGSLTNAGAMVGNTVMPVFVMRDLSIAPAMFAALGMVSAVGAIVGAAAGPRLTKKLGLRRLRLGAAALSMPVVAVAVFCQQLAGPDLLWLAVESLGWAFLVSAAAVAGADVLPRSVDPSELASVGSAQRTMTLGVMPVAALAGGAAATLVGSVPVLCLWVLLAGAAAIPLLRRDSLGSF
ncbi:MFS transporter [Arthrobacter rhombi]